jgi:hypothetical protein
MVGNAGALVWLLALQAQGAGVGSAVVDQGLRDAPETGLAGDTPEPGALLHPLRLELDRVTPGWRIARLEVLLDGAVIASRDPEAAVGDDGWSGTVAAGAHVLTATLLLRSETARDDQGQPLQMRVERARYFRAGPSEALALLIQAPPGRDQAPQIELSTRSAPALTWSRRDR